jgi:hypothetical protein
MVQVAAYAQWRCGDEAASSSASSSAEPQDLKWRPGLTASEVKARAKEMRKAISQRGERRLAERHAKSVASQSAVSIDDQRTEETEGEEGAEEESGSPGRTRGSRLHKPAAILQRLLWASDEDAEAAAPPVVWLLKEEEGEQRWCRQWVRSGTCRFGATCRHAHVLSLSGEVALACNRGAAMPAIEKASDPAHLAPEQLRRIAFVVSSDGQAAYDCAPCLRHPTPCHTSPHATPRHTSPHAIPRPVTRPLTPRPVTRPLTPHAAT